VGHAKLIGIVTFISRLVGLLGEMIALSCFGASGVFGAWNVAFAVPNLFRKLLGEGALSAAFVPMYAKSLKRDPDANEFAIASVNLLAGLLLIITIVGELVLIGLLCAFHFSADNVLVLRFSVVMLPYVTLVCLTAFLGGILQVHERFIAFATTPIVLNVFQIILIVILARSMNLSDRNQQIVANYWLSGVVLVAGVVQMVMLFPSLHAAGFRFHLMLRCWTPPVKQLIGLTLPLAAGAGVLQVGTMLDKAIAQAFAQAPGHDFFHIAGHAIRYPILEGAVVRLTEAQSMYQFPLAVFAIALATAMFPLLSREAIEPTGEGFKRVLRQGITGSMFIGLPASAGMVIIAQPAMHLIFQRGRFTSSDAEWMALSTAIYSSAIWAFSLLQIVNRGFYSLHDARTPLRWLIYNLIINLVVEVPLLWTRLGESGMAVGTLVSFAIQSVAMLMILNRRINGIHLHLLLPNVLRMVAATLLMLIVCLAIKHTPIYPHGTGKIAWAGQAGLLVVVGSAIYFIGCMVMGLNVLQHLPIRRRKS
jgi:putative peptidoglycan lipid II flippase